MNDQLIHRLRGWTTAEYSAMNNNAIELAQELADSDPLTILYALEMAHRNGMIEAMSLSRRGAEQLESATVDGRQRLLRIVKETATRKARKDSDE